MSVRTRHSRRKIEAILKSHPIVVIKEHLVKAVFHKPELSGRMVKRAVELSEHYISFQHRSAVKAHALAYFIADFTPLAVKEPEVDVSSIEANQTRVWKLLVDSAAS